MQGTNPPTFRPTVWPAEPPEVPPVIAPGLVPVEPGFYVSPSTGGNEWVELPPDFVLRELLDTANASEAEILTFSNRWGLVTGFGSEHAFRNFRSDAAASDVAALKELEQRLGHPWVVSSAALDIALRTLRSLARHLLAYLEEQGDDAIVAAWTTEGDDLEILAEQDTSDVSNAWWLWEHYLNLGLRPFTVRVRTGHPDWTGDPGSNLFNACCLQMANYLASEGTVQRCANERCGRPFTRQRGRARDEYGQHRSRGVRYCSHLCAKAQSERDRRRRRSEERKLS